MSTTEKQAQRASQFKAALNAIVNEAYTYQRDFIIFEGDPAEFLPTFTVKAIEQVVALHTELQVGDPREIAYVNENDEVVTDRAAGRPVGIPIQIAEIVFTFFWLCRRLGLDVGTLMVEWLKNARHMSESVREALASVSLSEGADEPEAEAGEADGVSSVTP